MHRFVIGLMAVLVACTQTVADEAISTCQPLCRCVDVPLPTEQRACVASCTIQFEMSPLSEACAACVVGHANRCPTLLDDCDTACRQAVPLQAYGEPQ